MGVEIPEARASAGFSSVARTRRPKLVRDNNQLLVTARYIELNPVAAGMRGLSTAFGAATDYSPDGHAARAELICKADRLAFPVRDDIPVMLEDDARKLAPDEEANE